MNISESERNALYKVIFSRRDVRSEFLPKVVANDVVQRILKAAHHAPSVGFMQPWDFIVVTDTEKKIAIKKGFTEANKHSSALFTPEKSSQYNKLKLEGIVEAPLGICVTCDRNRNGPVVLGRTIKPEMDLYSAVCAVQNMWLAARAENLGLGWVSIIHDSVLRDVLAIPENIDIIGYLCLGYVSEFKAKPELEEKGWLPRMDIDDVIHHNAWSK
ncbi:5,6-dimethylbenzimidazole synthase [Colwellia psychrerythraea]|uniref:5,6-dimethylbenzimidazole synthase n=1 Tax=Colwellia psychrerythraea TaxID=28229 RepID=A0A1Y5EWZ1_COLPS|nr:5,6-dimethylbenzimidazole synthase [Colwellia psychrerythraea]